MRHNTAIQLLSLLLSVILMSCQKDLAELVECKTNEPESVTDVTVILSGTATFKDSGNMADMTPCLYYSSTATEVNDLLREGEKIEITSFSPGGRFSMQVKYVKPETTYYFVAAIHSGDQVVCGKVKSFKTYPRRTPSDAVDLGVVVKRDDGSTYKLFWAPSNLRASDRQDFYGSFYPWGDVNEIVPHGLPWSDVSVRSYRFWNKTVSWGEDNCLTKYCTQEKYWGGTGVMDNRSVLKTGINGDDAASKQLGALWRTPTSNEWKALLNQCNWQYDSGRGGYVITSRVEGNDNSIFLPEVLSYWRSEDGSSYKRERDGLGFYWASDINTDYPTFAYCLFTNGTNHGMHLQSRLNAFAIRPVTE